MDPFDNSILPFDLHIVRFGLFNHPFGMAVVSISTTVWRKYCLCTPYGVLYMQTTHNTSCR